MPRYGLGNIYFRQEKYELSAYHFKRALAINDRSSVLYCYLSMALHANKRVEEALQMLERAETLETTSPLAKFQKANVYMSLGQWDHALAQAQAVLAMAPQEASVHFLLGKIYKRLEQPEKAVVCFITALDLDPKDQNLVKAAIDKLAVPSLDERDLEE